MAFRRSRWRFDDATLVLISREAKSRSLSLTNQICDHSSSGFSYLMASLQRSPGLICFLWSCLYRRSPWSTTCSTGHQLSHWPNHASCVRSIRKRRTTTSKDCKRGPSSPCVQPFSVRFPIWWRSLREKSDKQLFLLLCQSSYLWKEFRRRCSSHFVFLNNSLQRNFFMTWNEYIEMFLEIVFLRVPMPAKSDAQGNVEECVPKDVHGVPFFAWFTWMEFGYHGIVFCEVIIERDRGMVRTETCMPLIHRPHVRRNAIDKMRPSARLIRPYFHFHD